MTATLIPSRSRPRQAENIGLHNHRDNSSGGRLSAKDIDDWTSTGSSITDHHLLLNLTTYDDHPQYFYLAGRSGGQTAYGGIDVAEDLTLSSTADGGKGSIYFGEVHASAYDELNDRLGVGTASPNATLHVFGDPQAASTFARPGVGGTGSFVAHGAATIGECLDEVIDDDDTTYASGAGNDQAHIPITTSGLVGSSGFLVIRCRADGIGTYTNMTVHCTAGPADYNISGVTTSYANFSHALSGAEISALVAAGSIDLVLTIAVGDSTWRVTKAYFQADSTAASTLSLFEFGDPGTTGDFARWVDGNGDIVASIDYAGAGHFQNVVLEDSAGTGNVTLKAPAGVTSWNLTFPSNDGSANDVLTSDGSGVTSWAAFSSLLDADLVEIAAVNNVRGDILITNSGPTWTRLAIGAPTYVLTSDGTDVSWQPASGGPGSSLLTVVTKTSNYTALTSDGVILCNGTLTITLYTAVSNTGRVLHIKNIGSGVVTVDPNGNETVDGNTSLTIDLSYDSVMLVADGSNWEIL